FALAARFLAGSPCRLFIPQVFGLYSYKKDLVPNGLERLKPVSCSGYEVPIGVGVNVLGVGVPVGKGVFVGAGVLVVAGGKVGMVVGFLVIVGGIDIAVGVQVAVAVPVATPVGVGVGAPQLDNETRTSRHNS